MQLKRIPDKNLWENVRQGDVIAFEELYHSYSAILYMFGLKYTSRVEIIEDCIQELFSGIFKNHKNLGPTDNIRFYLFKSFKNKLFRTLKNEKKHTSDKITDYNFEVQFSIEHEIMNSEEKQREKAILLSFVERLSSRQKVAIYLRYTNQMEYEEISVIMEMEIESCRNLIARAIKTLRFKMQNSTLLLFLLFKENS